jgi:hypothetical protein
VSCNGEGKMQGQVDGEQNCKDWLEEANTDLYMGTGPSLQH